MFFIETCHQSMCLKYHDCKCTTERIYKNYWIYCNIMTTIVSCYYKAKISKHSHNDYDNWIRAFVLNLQEVNIIVFTQESDKQYLIDIFEQNKHVNYKIVVKELADFEIVQKYPDIWEHQEKIDPQQHISRRKECYIIWNSKFNFVKEAMDMNPFQSDYFIWNDIGNVRNIHSVKCLHNYPNQSKISEDKLDIILLRPFVNTPNIFYNNEVHFSGSMFGGHKNILYTLHKKYYEVFELYIQYKQFIGCDQQLISTMYRQHPSLFNTIIPQRGIIDEWFYLYYYYN